MVGRSTRSLGIDQNMSGLFDHPYLLIGLIVLNWPVYVQVAKTLALDRDEIHDAVHYSIIPDIFFLGSVDWGDMQWTSGRFALFVALCVLFVAAEYLAATHLIGWIAQW